MGTTKYDTIINFFLDHWITAFIVFMIVIVMAVPQFRDGLKVIYDLIFNRNKERKAIGDKIDTQLLRLLIKADEAIRKENQDYYLHGCGSAFNDVYALSEY